MAAIVVMHLVGNDAVAWSVKREQHKEEYSKSKAGQCGQSEIAKLLQQTCGTWRRVPDVASGMDARPVGW